MLLQLIVGPASTLLTLPPKVCVLLLALTSITSGLCLGIPGVQAGKVRTPEHLTISVSFGFALMACAGLVWQFAWPQRMEDNFDLHPWRRKPPSICPYTGKMPSMRCPVCETWVHESAFHTQEPLTTWYVGESVLGWDKASSAMDLLSRPAEGRRVLDEALDWRGNYYFGCTGNGCLGCATWQRSFNMLPRWCLTLLLIASVGTLVPWAFQASLVNLDHGGKVQAIAEVYGLFFSLCALFIEAHAIACALVFMSSYDGIIAFPAPVTVDRSSFTGKLVALLAGQSLVDSQGHSSSRQQTWEEMVAEVSERVASVPEGLRRYLERNESWSRSRRSF